MSTTGALDQQRNCQYWGRPRRRLDPVDRWRADQHRHAGYRHINVVGSVTAKSFVNSGTVDLTGTGRFRRPQRVGSADQQRLDFDRLRHRGARRSGRRRGVLQPLQHANLQFDSSVSAGQTINETGADALTLKQAQSFAATISGFGTGDTIDATNFLETANALQFRREFGEDRRHAHPDRHEFESDRQYPDDRRLFELEFHPRPRQRDRHAGEVRLSRRRAALPCGHGAAIRVRERTS